MDMTNRVAGSTPNLDHSPAAVGWVSQKEYRRISVILLQALQFPELIENKLAKYKLQKKEKCVKKSIRYQ